MGEAKRRKQALGDRYGNTPPVLMPESEQLEEHAKKFTDAFLAKFKENSRELLATFLDVDQETLDRICQDWIVKIRCLAMKNYSVQILFLRGIKHIFKFYYPDQEFLSAG